MVFFRPSEIKACKIQALSLTVRTKLHIHYCLPPPVKNKEIAGFRWISKNKVLAELRMSENKNNLYCALWLLGLCSTCARTCLWFCQYFENITSQVSDFLWSGSMQMDRCCNCRCHKQGQTCSQHLSWSRTLSPWHKKICHSEQEYALQGSCWHQVISAGLIQNTVFPSGRRQIKHTKGQIAWRGKIQAKRKTSGTSFANLFNHVNWCKLKWSVRSK